jgi:hypothetical protein
LSAHLKGNEQKISNQEEERWWRKMIQESLKAEEATRCWIPPLSTDEVWQHSVDWIYYRFERLQKQVHTGITTEQLHDSMKHCSYQHPEKELPWFFLRPGTREYIAVVKRNSLAEMRMWQQAWLAGDHDARGNRWCGMCSQRYQMMNAGEACGYANAYSFYAEAETREVIGYDRWLDLAKHTSYVLAGMLAESVFKRRYEEHREISTEVPFGRCGHDEF